MTEPSIQTLLDADPDTMSYEQARDGLARIVERLEDGSPSLEESLTLWEQGERLAKRCGAWLEMAQQRLDKAKSDPAPDAASPIPAPGAESPAADPGSE